MTISFLNLLVLYGAVHLIGDFAFQNTWMAQFKGKDWGVLLWHCLTYTAPFAMLMLIPDMPVTKTGLVLIVLTHYLIDALKARWQVIKSIWLDQLCHAGVLVGLIGVGLM